MSELELPSIGFGTSGNTDPDECAESVAAALDVGYRHIDTAQMYDNEAHVGEGIDRSEVDRDEIVVATKIHPDNLAPNDVEATTRASLDRLGLDRVDLLYVHWPTGAYEAEETLPAFDRLVDDGITDHVGVSNFTPALLDEARGILDHPIAAHQVECHPLLRQEELRAYASAHGHSLVAYTPLGRGEFFDNPTLNEIARRHDATVPAICLAWEMAQERVVPIPKATGAHIRANWEAREIELSERERTEIDEIGTERRVIDPDDAPWHN
ncbi:aldo/keto reductase [Haloferacaceae archaeon DSL9]